MKTLICLTLAVSALASPALTFAQTISGQLTRAQVRADIVRVEQAGYRPGSGDNDYPVEIQAAEAKIAEADGENISIGENRAPVQFRGAELRIFPRQSPLDMSQLRRRDPGMLARPIACDEEPYRARRESDARAGPEGRAPAAVLQEIDDQTRRDSGAESHARENDAVRDASLGRRNPRGNDAVCRGVNYSLPDAEREANRNEDRQQRGQLNREQCDQDSENRPPHDAKREDEPRPETIGNASTRSLKQGVPEHEGAQDITKLDIGEVKFFFNRAAGDGEVYTIEISDRRNNEHPADQDPSEHFLCSIAVGANRNAALHWLQGRVYVRLRFKRLTASAAVRSASAATMEASASTAATVETTAATRGVTARWSRVAAGRSRGAT